MATVTVVPSDRTIIVDGVAVEADFSVSQEIHAIQWAEGKGHIEFVHKQQEEQQGQQEQQGKTMQPGEQILPLTEDMYPQYVAPFVAIWEEKRKGDTPPPTDIEALAEMKYAEIIAGANECMGIFKARYSCCEEDTWPLQEAGARMLLACENLTKNSQSLVILSQDILRKRAVQLVEDLAGERGMRPETMAERIVQRADSAARYSQIIYAEQRNYERLLDDLVISGNRQRIMDLDVTYTRPGTFMED